MNRIKLRDCVKHILSISRLGNQYIQENEPWKQFKGNDAEKKRAATVTCVATNLACLLSILIEPYMPTTAATIWSQLNVKKADVCVLTENSTFTQLLKSGHSINTPAPLFKKLDVSELESLKKRFAGQKPKETDAEAAKGASAAAAAGGDKAASPTKTPEEIAELESKVTAQGLVVRELKANKAPAAQVTAEVGKLLDLKKELTSAKGAGGAKASKAGKPKQQQKKNPANAKPKAPKAVPVKSPEEIAEINSRVTAQGLLVREIKAKKAPADEIKAQIEHLLLLKKELALAKGENPNPPPKKGKKNMK